MFTFSADLQHRVAGRVSGLVADKLGVEPPESWNAPWEIMVDGYLPVELHFHHGKVFFVGVVSDYGNPADDEQLHQRALDLSRETLASGWLTVCLEQATGRLVVWMPAQDELSDDELLRQFAGFISEFDLWYGKLIDRPGTTGRQPPPSQFSIVG